VITTVADLTFTPDFDARLGTGRALAAVIAVTQAANHQGTTYGGVFGSADGAAWQQAGPGSALDGGAQSVAVTRTGRVLAAYIGFAAGQGVTGGLLCSTDLRSWQPFCPAVRTAQAPGRAAGAAAAGSPTPAAAGVGAATTPGGQVDGAAAAAAAKPAAAAAAGGQRSLLAAMERPAAIAVPVLGGLALLSSLRRRRRGDRGRDSSGAD